MFSYDEFIKRNIGFLSPKEQDLLKRSRIFVPGVGGMGGTAVECLARSGVENFIICDPDSFEVSNLNRQIFSEIRHIGSNKAEVAAQKLREINPDITVRIVGVQWTEQLDQILPEVDIVINGCDDGIATAKLMRKAKQHNKVVIDAFASTLPSVYVVKPQDPRPEEFLKFPTLGKDWKDLHEGLQPELTFKELVYVLTHSSTVKHVLLDYAAEMVSGKRKRMSLAPMVWGTGILMSYEAIKYLVNRPTQASCYGVFMNPWTFQFEKAKPGFISWIKEKFVVHFLNKMSQG